MAKLLRPRDVWRVRQHADSPDRAAVLVAESQLGMISVEQLDIVGIGRGARRRRRERGILHPWLRGVYLMGHRVPPPAAREVAALLATAPGAVVSHLSAAWLWGLVITEADPVEVTVPRGHPRTRTGLRIHRAPLPQTDLRTCRGLPLTSPARTLLDLAAAGYPHLEAAVSEAQATRLLTPAQLQEVVERSRRRRGVADLRKAAEADDRGFTRSEAERVMRRLCHRARLPQPQANARVAGWEVDLFWPAARFIVEVDGYGVHGHRAAFERDRRKQVALVTAGFRVIRVTWRQLIDEPLTVIAAVAAALGADVADH